MMDDQKNIKLPFNMSVSTSSFSWSRRDNNNFWSEQ